jgi:flagellar basal body-associated protein FliL
MAEEEASNSDEPVKKSKGIVKIVAGVSLVAFLGGAAGGYTLSNTLNTEIDAATPKADSSEDEPYTPATPDELEHGVGKIVVALSSDPNIGTETARLLIDPVIVYELKGDHDGADHKKLAAKGSYIFESKNSALRDAFIEYLSQLTVEETRGSYGLMTIRAELARRARLAVEDAHISGVLIQELMVQQ